MLGTLDEQFNSKYEVLRTCATYEYKVRPTMRLHLASLKRGDVIITPILASTPHLIRLPAYSSTPYIAVSLKLFTEAANKRGCE